MYFEGKIFLRQRFYSFVLLSVIQNKVETNLR